MNIALLCVLIIITGETDGFHVENIRAPFKEETGERIPLRKLQSFEHEDPKEAKTVTWNQILADAFVNRLTLFSFHREIENEQAPDHEISNNFVTNCVSQMMYLYKTLVYDIYKRSNTKVRNYEETELNTVNRNIHNDVDKNVNVETEQVTLDPKDEVEIIEPQYHGKICDNCGETEKNNAKNGTSEIVETTETAQTSLPCPSGLVANEAGGCTEPKSKFILSIPYQCPIGYRRDWLGFCRPQL